MSIPTLHVSCIVFRQQIIAGPCIWNGFINKKITVAVGAMCTTCFTSGQNINVQIYYSAQLAGDS